jgi:hypothetical protein
MKKDRNPIQREKNGDIKFLVGDNVNNSNNKIKNGDAAFHEAGTSLYRI